MKKKSMPLLGKALGWLLPGYALIPLILCVAFNFLVFCGTRPLTDGRTHYDFSFSLDHMIPFWPPIVVIYVLAFLQWIIGYVMIGRGEKELCYRFTAGDMIAKFICLVCFLVIPTAIVRPQFQVTDFYTWLTNIIYTTDAPNNLFPSIHCLESWVVWRASLDMKNVPVWYRCSMFIMTILVCASTVLLKQHFVVDIIGGIAAAEFGIWLARRTQIGIKLFGWSEINY